MSNAVRNFWIKAINGETDSKAISKIECRLECVDGFSMTVKAGEYWYSEPECHLPDGNYKEWEIGFPSRKEEFLDKYYRNVGYSMGNVFGYVPTETVNQIIAKHGGIIGA